METLARAGVETLNSVFIVNKAFEKLSKQKIPFTPEETEQILGQTASVLNKLNEKKLELNKEDLQVPEDKLEDILIKFDLGKFHQKIRKIVKKIEKIRKKTPKMKISRAEFFFSPGFWIKSENWSRKIDSTSKKFRR